MLYCKMHLSSPVALRPLSVLRRWLCGCCFLFIAAPIVCAGSVFGPCLVFVSF